MQGEQLKQSALTPSFSLNRILLSRNRCVLFFNMGIAGKGKKISQIIAGYGSFRNTSMGYIYHDTETNILLAISIGRSRNVDVFVRPPHARK